MCVKAALRKAPPRKSFFVQNPCQQLCIFHAAPSQQSSPLAIYPSVRSRWLMHLTNFSPRMSHCPAFGINFTRLRRTLFRDNRIDGICLETPVPKALHFRPLPIQLSPGYFHVLDPPIFQDNHIEKIVLKTRATSFAFCITPCQLNSPQAVSTVHRVLRSRSLHQRSSPRAISTLHRPSTSSGASISLPSAELTPSYFQASPSIHPPSYFHTSQSIHSRPALRSRSLQRSAPRAISTLHSPSTFVRLFDLVPSSAHTSPSIHLPPELRSRSFQQML